MTSSKLTSFLGPVANSVRWQFALYLVSAATVTLGETGNARAEDDPVDGNIVTASLWNTHSVFDYVTYEWNLSGPTGILAARGVVAPNIEDVSSIALVTRAELLEFADELNACDAGLAAPTELPVAPSAADLQALGCTRVALVYRAFDSSRAVLCDDEATACLEVIAGPIERISPMRINWNTLWETGTYGAIRTQTDIPARVFVDGNPTGMMTTDEEIRVLPGLRTVRLEPAGSPENAIEQVVEVGLGQITRVQVRLNGTL